MTRFFSTALLDLLLLPSKLVTRPSSSPRRRTGTVVCVFALAKLAASYKCVGEGFFPSYSSSSWRHATLTETAIGSLHQMQDTPRWKRQAANVKAPMLVIVSKQDHTVTPPQPALDFAAAVHAETLVLDSDCGHGAPFCEGGSCITASERIS
jgi:pimeloyl-ACP methyl ester carboxylesterase